MESNNSYIRKLYREIFIAFALGTLSTFIAYRVGGIELLESMVISQIPHHSILWYLFALPGTYLIAIIFDRYIWKRTDEMRARAAWWRATFEEVGAAFHSLWRVLAGLFFAIPILWIIHSPEDFQIRLAGFFAFWGSMLLAQCWFISVGRSKLEAKQYRPTN